MTNKPKQPVMPRMWRYEVTDVWGEMVGRLENGTILIDRWKADRHWEIANFKKKGDPIVGGWSAKLVGEVVEPDMILKLCEKHGWRPRGATE